MLRHKLEHGFLTGERSPTFKTAVVGHPPNFVEGQGPVSGWLWTNHLPSSDLVIIVD